MYLSKLMKIKKETLEGVSKTDSNSSETTTETITARMSVGVSHIEKMFKKAIYKIVFLRKTGTVITNYTIQSIIFILMIFSIEISECPLPARFEL